MPSTVIFFSAAKKRHGFVMRPSRRKKHGLQSARRNTSRSRSVSKRARNLGVLSGSEKLQKAS